MEFVPFGLTWLYLFYNAKKQTLKKPWIFALIFICVALILFNFYISFDDLPVKVYPIVFLVIYLLVNGPKEFKKDLFNREDFKESLLISAIISVPFILIKIAFDRNNDSVASLTVVETALPIIQTTFAEELIFRGFLISYLLDQKIKPGWVILIQTICFLGGHIYYINFPNAWLHFIYAGLFGTIAGYIVIKYKNILGLLIVHILINLTLLFF